MNLDSGKIRLAGKLAYPTVVHCDFFLSLGFWKKKKSIVNCSESMYFLSKIFVLPLQILGDELWSMKYINRMELV